MNTDQISFKKNCHLLVIDDEEEIREILCALLEEVAEKIDQACNGQEAIELINNNRYDLILSDQRMPQKTGLEVLQWMNDNRIQIPFIIQTGYEQSEVSKKAKELGVYALLNKPWEEENLLQIVKDALANKLS